MDDDDDDDDAAAAAAAADDDDDDVEVELKDGSHDEDGEKEEKDEDNDEDDGYDGYGDGDPYNSEHLRMSISMEDIYDEADLCYCFTPPQRAHACTGAVGGER